MQEFTTTNKCNQGGSMKVNVNQLKFIIQNICRINNDAKVKFIGRSWKSSTDESDFVNEEYTKLQGISINFADNKNEEDEIIIKVT